MCSEVSTMNVEIVDWLNASVVIVGSGLLETETEIRSFADRTSPQEVRYNSLQGPDGTKLTAQLEIRKERVTIEGSNERVAIVKEYPDGGWERLADIATFVLESSANPVLTARGYNVALVFGSQHGVTADEYIVSNIFTSLTVPGWNFSGGSATLRFKDESRQGVWTVKIEPRVGSNKRRVFMDLNLHLPGAIELDEIHGYVDYVRSGVLSFLESLELSRR